MKLFWAVSDCQFYSFDCGYENCNSFIVTSPVSMKRPSVFGYNPLEKPLLFILYSFPFSIGCISSLPARRYCKQSRQVSCIWIKKEIWPSIEKIKHNTHDALNRRLSQCGIHVWCPPNQTTCHCTIKTQEPASFEHPQMLLIVIILLGTKLGLSWSQMVGCPPCPITDCFHPLYWNMVD